MSISAKDVMKLRQMSGAGMMDCKKALTDSAGDIDTAFEYLRKKGLKTAAKRAEREANEGVVATFIAEDQRSGGILELLCETDFVAKTDEFKQFADDLARTMQERKITVAEELLQQDSLALPGKTFNDQLSGIVAKLGEKMHIGRCGRLEVASDSQGLVKSYIHLGSKQGVIVQVDAGNSDSLTAASFQTMVNDLALQIAAFNPIAVDENGVDKTVIEQELDVYREQARNEGKPEQILDKIATGKLRKFYSEVTLLAQSFVKEEKLTVKQHIEAVGGELSDQLQVVGFISINIGK
ncbi:MAG: elongation factor Ts [Candidatus Delongbacteria bacterium]|nr:elongation factor Ts [Candidatus Delongbacteria bacterium]